MEENREKISPYRMACLMEVAGRTAKQMTSGVWNLTFDEMELVLGIIQREINASRKENKGE